MIGSSLSLFTYKHKKVVLLLV